MDYPYLVKSKHHLAQYLACNALPKGYVFYSMSWIPDGKDPLTVDAKLMLTYSTTMSKSKAYRRKKAGIATVKYLRLGRLCVLLATRGESPFFDKEGWSDCRENPICFGGYSIALREGKVSVRLHREAQRRLKKFILNWSNKRSREWWERWIWRFPFLAFRGVQDNVYSLVKMLNANRKSFRLEPVDKGCIRRTYTPDAIWLESPREIVELIRWEEKR